MGKRVEMVLYLQEVENTTKMTIMVPEQKLKEEHDKQGYLFEENKNGSCPKHAY